MLGKLLPALLCIAIWFAGTVPPAHATDEQPDPIKLPSELRDMEAAEATKLGMEAATADSAAGRYRVLFHGQRAGPTEAGLKLQALGVRFESVAGCVVSEGILGFEDGYNSTMEQLLKTKFRTSVFEETRTAPR